MTSPFEDALDDRHPLRGMLALAVPLEIATLRHLDDDTRDRVISEYVGKTVATLLGEAGDQLLYGGPRCAAAFAALTRALACLAWAPGGVSFAGLHFCARHQECVAAAAYVAEHPDVPLPDPPDGRPVETVELPLFTEPAGWSV